MQPLWTFSELIAVLNPGSPGCVGQPATGVSIDTRTLREGDLFVALKDQRDGHEFVPAAFNAGAAAALVSYVYQRQSTDGALFRVTDTLKGLEALGIASRARLDPAARVIAVTGSAGKTGTKEMLRACLGRLGAVHASEKSYNNHWGVPLTLARMPRATQFGVFEIGMNHAGEIRPLTKMVRPHAAIITTVEAVHLEYFPSVEAIADAKGEIFEGLAEGGSAIIKADNPHADRLKAIARRYGARPMTFGFGADADVRGEDLQLGHEGSAFVVRLGGRRIRVQLAVSGRHIAENALAVVAALDAIGADVETAVTVLGSLEAPGGRGARNVLQIAGGEALLIDESYNANPASMRAALATLAAIPRQKFSRRIAVLGDMLELGAASKALHEGLKEAIEAAGIDLVFACGSHMKGLFDALPAAKKGGYASTSSELQDTLLSSLRGGDAIMIKASNGTRLGLIVAALRAEFGNAGPVSQTDQ